jgi:hypothetical protein
MSREDWPFIVGAALYFLYAAALLFVAIGGYLIYEGERSTVHLVLGAFLALICGVLGVALLKAKNGNIEWLLWTGGAAGVLAAMSKGWLGPPLFLLPMALGLWGLHRIQRGS